MKYFNFGSIPKKVIVDSEYLFIMVAGIVIFFRDYLNNSIGAIIVGNIVVTFIGMNFLIALKCDKSLSFLMSTNALGGIIYFMVVLDTFHSEPFSKFSLIAAIFNAFFAHFMSNELNNDS